MKFSNPLFLFLLLLFTTTYNNLLATGNECVTSWKKGDQKIYTITKNKHTEGKVPFSLMLQVDINVQEVTDTGCTIAWTYHLDQKLKDSLPEIVNYFPLEGLQIRFLTERNGAFKSLLNWQDIADAYYKMLLYNLPAQLDSTQEAILAQTKATFYNQQAIEQTGINEIQLFHSMYGTDLGSLPVQQETEIQVALSNSLISANLTIELLQQKKKDCVAIHSKRVATDEALKQILKDFMKKMNVPMTENSEAIFSNMKISEEGNFFFHTPTYWPDKIVYTRNLILNTDMSDIETYVIELK